jgi:putative ABC transport system permease protein
MINSYKEITGKYLKANKKRTVLNLIGIILSVALISAVGFFFKSMQAAQIQDMKNTYGSWHLMYTKVDDNLIRKIESNPNVLRSGTYTTEKEINIDEKLKARKVFVSNDGLKLLPYKLKQGRFPEKSTEVVMERWFLGKVKNGAKLGDSIKILDKEYTLVGILSDTLRNQESSTGEVITLDAEVNKGQRILLLELRSNKTLGANIAQLKKLSAEKSVAENSYLLATQGEGMPKQLLAVLAIIIAVVVIATIAVIYNAFQISVVERVRQFGLLRAIGTTPKQIREIILREATFLAVIGIPLGLGSGIIALYSINLAFKLIGGKDLMMISPTISWDVLLISIIVSLLSIYVSALLPALFAGRISPLVAISSRNSITKEKIKKRKSFLTGNIFGFEGTLASKNIRRNRKRYRTTVFSIVISVTLFIIFKSFMDMTLNVYSENNESQNIHFSVETTGNDGIENGEVASNIVESVSKLPQVAATYKEYNPYFFDAVIDKNNEVRSINSIGDIYKDINYNGQNKTLLGGSLEIYDEKSLEIAKKYVKEGNINIDNINKEKGVIIIAKNRIYNKKSRNSFYGQITDLKMGDEILLQEDGLRFSKTVQKTEFGTGNVKNVKVVAILAGNPFNFRGSEDDIKMITTKEVAKELTAKDIKVEGLNLKLKDIKFEDATRDNLERIISKSGDLKLINIVDRNRQTRSVILMVEILLYGFVVVVSLIGSINIINTLTTNIVLRKKEFAALQCIGLTRKGLRKMITLEGMLYGIMGCIYGSAAGTLLSYVIYKGISDIRDQKYIFPINAIIIAAVGAMIIAYISVLTPLRRMKKENLIDSVREDF